MEQKKSLSNKQSFDALNDNEKLKYKENVIKIYIELVKDKLAMTKLTRYTLKKIIKYTNHHSINAKEAKDFLQDAFLITVDGYRPFWGKTKEDLLGHLYYIIPSIICNEAKKIKVKLEVQNEAGKKAIYKDKFMRIDEIKENYYNNNMSGLDLASEESSILDQIIFQELLNEVESFIYSELRKNNDTISMCLYKARLKGTKNPHKYVAQQLNVAIKEVQNAAKRLKRIINKAMRYYYEG